MASISFTRQADYDENNTVVLFIDGLASVYSGTSASYTLSYDNVGFYMSGTSDDGRSYFGDQSGPTQITYNNYSVFLDLRDNLTSIFAQGGLFGDRLFSGAGNDILHGGIGDDTLNGGSAADVMDGGDDDDLYYVDTASDVVLETADRGFDTVLASASYTLRADVEVEVLATTNGNSTSAINLTGNAIAQTLEGNAGSNILNGGGGADTMAGSGGSDTYYVDNVGDVVNEDAGQGTDQVISSINYTLGVNVENLTLTGGTALNATGNALNNRINGTNNANTLSGDIGADTMTGFAGDDTYYVDNSGDVVVEAVNGGGDRVKASVSYALAANVENLQLTGGAISGIGNTLSNAIQGTGGNNILDGGLGNDTLTGGAGADRFSFSTTLGANNVDTITDFQAPGNVDTIRLENAVFVGLPTGALASNAFVIGNKAADGQDRVIYNSNTGDLFFDRDGNGSTYAAIKFAHVDPGLSMTAGDFTVI